jgi:hypothetical protein
VVQRPTAATEKFYGIDGLDRAVTAAPASALPRPLATLAQQRVELGATNGDGAAVWQRHDAARRIHGRDQVAFRDSTRMGYALAFAGVDLH